ncbi:hypothetical protein F5Y18DRAFT_356119 [Xylariaceae sp. FL1019]|nr:hypothetical protein F5Y18DRAFT_356119 [Xylariaceae sp. FL1019]
MMSTLSPGATSGIAVAGAILIFLVLGPVLIQLAKHADRQRVATCPISSLPFTENVEHSANKRSGPGKLRKKTPVREHILEHAMTESTTGREEVKSGHLSLPSFLPPVFSRPGSFSFPPLHAWKTPSGSGGDTRSENHTQTRARAYTCANPNTDLERPSAHSSPEKQRGYLIAQNRRKRSWIDEDTLHGPRVWSPKNRTGRPGNRKAGWFAGRGIPRQLTRHLSIRNRRDIPEVAQSPTLPCTETGQGRDIQSQLGTPSKIARNVYDLASEVETGPRLPLHENGVHIRIVSPLAQAQRAPVPLSSTSSTRQRSDALIAAQQLAGRARVPSGPDFPNFGLQKSKSSTDVELQAILQRTAEKLGDGNRSARRQTLLLTTTSSLPFPATVVGQRDGVCGCGKEHEVTSGTHPVSPSRSQKSAPTVLFYSELEGCTPRADTVSRPGHKRTHTRQISYASQISQLSMLSEADSMTVSLPQSRDGSQPDIYTALSSPSRMGQKTTSPQHSVTVPSYSPASSQSSGLSTVYSEEESGVGMEHKAMNEVLHACDALSEQQDMAKSLVRQDRFHHSPHAKNGTMGQIVLSTTTVVASPQRGVSEVDVKKVESVPSVRKSSKPVSPFTIRDTAEDPFTTCATPTRSRPRRLSQVFSPLPAELPGSSANPSVHVMPAGSPTPSPTHRRAFPPPHQLRPAGSSPTLGQRHQENVRLHVQLSPTRQASPAASEGGLSSVYESYRYSRNSDTSPRLSLRLSTSTSLWTVPTAEGSPTKSSWDGELALAFADTKRGSGGKSPVFEFRAGDVGSGSAGEKAAYKLTHGTSTMTCQESVSIVQEAGRRRALERETSVSVASDASAGSQYSQDEDTRDAACPLIVRPTTTEAAVKHSLRVASTVAELRRMNSQVSTASGYSAVTTGPSPTLPALRGGGFSPGKKGAGGGAKNYLSLGNNPQASGSKGIVNSSDTEAQKISHGGDNQEKAGTATVAARQDSTRGSSRDVGNTKETMPLRRGGAGGGRSRRSTVVMRFEEDLDRARQVLRESRGNSAQPVPEHSRKGATAGQLPTRVSKLLKEEGRASLEGVSLYDEKGFLKTPSSSSPVATRKI